MLYTIALQVSFEYKPYPESMAPIDEVNTAFPPRRGCRMTLFQDAYTGGWCTSPHNLFWPLVT